MTSVHTAPPPDDVTRLLRAHGARPAAAVGTDGTWWVGRPVEEDGTWLEVLVADVPVDGPLSARAVLLTQLEHPHLARVLAVEPLDPGRVALVCEHVTGPTLAAVRAARPPLADGEVVTVAVPVAQALAELHAAGLAHGAVGADRVVLRPGGVPVLVDLRGALLGAGTATGDVHRLVATLLGLMPSLDVHLAAGVDEAARLRDALEQLLRERATPEHLVDAVFAAATAQPVHVPAADELAGAQVALEAGRSGQPRAVDAPLPRRARRAPVRRRWPLALGAVAVAVVAAGGAVLGSRLLPGPDGATAAPVSTGASATAEATAAAAVAGAAQDDRAALADQGAPDVAAAALTRLRVAALAVPDGPGVAALEVDGSPAEQADAALVAQLAGARSEGLAVEVHSATVVGADADGDVRVAVTSTLSAHERVAPTGERSPVPQTGPRTVELVLRWTSDGWQVQDVSEPGAASR